MTKAKPISISEIRKTFPIGARVAYYPVRGLPGFELTHVASEPWTLPHGGNVVKLEGRTGGISVDHLALATDKQSGPIARRLATGRISVRANGKRFRPTIDKLPLHADAAPQGFDTKEAATAFAKSVRDAFVEARPDQAQPA